MILLDGGMGTLLWKAAEERGLQKVPVWRYNMECPEIVENVIREYAEAGAEIVQANTFGANRLNIARVSKYDPDEVIRRALEIAVSAAGNAKVTLSMGPLDQLMEPYGDLEEDEVYDIYYSALRTGKSCGAAMASLETFMDLNMLCVAARAARDAGLLALCTQTFENSGRTIFGNTPEEIVKRLKPLGVSGVGINCSFGPTAALKVLEAFRACSDLPLIFKPNAGMTQSDGYGAEDFVREVIPALEYAAYVGGCCGTEPSYIRGIAKYLGR